MINELVAVVALVYPKTYPYHWMIHLTFRTDYCAVTYPVLIGLN